MYRNSMPSSRRSPATTAPLSPSSPTRAEHKPARPAGEADSRDPIGAGLVHYIGGTQAASMDYLAGAYAKFPQCLLFVVAATYAVLLVFLRSAILPLKAVFMNTLSLFGAYGAVVWIFQQGHLSRLFDFTPAGHIDELTPIVMFCILFGLSMDYEVFLLSRVHEQYLLRVITRRAWRAGWSDG